MSEDFRAVSEKLDTLIRLVAAGLVLNKPQQEQIEVLSKAGFAPKDIAELLGTTANTVRVTLTEIRKGKKKRVKKRRKEKKSG